MATFQITAVRTEPGYGSPHSHISHLELNHSAGARIPRSVVVADLRNPWGDRYYTHGGGVRADVIVRGCPHCAFSEYITTTPDWTTDNNLLSLPRF